MLDVIIVNGHPRAGKDTFIKGMADRMAKGGKAVAYSFSTVDTIKVMLKRFGYKEENKDEYRNVLAEIKRLWSKNDGPLVYSLEQIEDIIEVLDHRKQEGVVFIQIREPEEIGKLVKALEVVENVMVKSVCIKRRGIDGQYVVDKHYTNAADQNVDDYQYDYYIINDGGLEEYEKDMDNFFKLIQGVE